MSERSSWQILPVPVLSLLPTIDTASGTKNRGRKSFCLVLALLKAREVMAGQCVRMERYSKSCLPAI